MTRPEESYRLCCVVVYDLETSRMGAPYIYDISRLRVKLLEVENVTGYRLGNRGSFRDEERYFIVPSRLERGPHPTLARRLKGFGPERKRGQGIR